MISINPSTGLRAGPLTTPGENPSTIARINPLAELRINLVPSTLDAAQVVNLWLCGRPVAGVSGTVGSVPALLRRLLTRRPDLVVAELEVTTVIGALVRSVPGAGEEEGV